MSRLLDFLAVLFSVIIAFSIGVIVAFYRPTTGITNAKHVVTEKNTDTKVPETTDSEENTIDVPENAPQEDKIDEEEKINETILSSFKRIKEGIAYYPALILKVRGVSSGTEIHLITFSTMEWPFIRTYISDDLVLEEPEKVFLCENGIVDVVYTVKGVWPPEIHREKLKGKGVLVVPDEKGNLNFKDFKGICSDNGFVFTRSGDLAGICFGSKFIGAEELYRTTPSNCQTVYPKEEGNDANLQGENR
ncbi:hypothetical protein [Phorcysia thermohydrogeniphila]|uniref:Uncharacterized protein n=1 Tax=Phorcysia thermohydrogeniphila TaxID=936138 RepID=A0A4R1GEE3_9BACT|nr:hypothetical protein [Phorcysia thermohydrogeniphila]TCK05160.1 hypothetical protein CLV27_0580 [Phorcysia thermohydrogeniphila]